MVWNRGVTFGLFAGRRAPGTTSPWRRGHAAAIAVFLIRWMSAGGEPG
jgi:hypothetical protein